MGSGGPKVAADGFLVPGKGLNISEGTFFTFKVHNLSIFVHAS